MTRRMSGLACTTVALLLLPTVALAAWKQEALFGARVHHHEFEQVQVDNNGDCLLGVHISFQAPAEGYKGESPARNYYRFIGRLKFDGRTVITRFFSNDKAGSRIYNDTIDTSTDGCWAKEKHKLHGIDVEGCRGKGCKPEPFK